MKKLIIIAVASSVLASTVFAQDAEAPAPTKEVYMIAKCYDHAKKMSYKLGTQVEIKALMDEVTAEAKLWAKAMAATEKAWKADPENAKKTFPKTAISPKKVTIIDTFTNQEKASNKLNSLESSIAAQDELATKRAESKKNDPMQKSLKKILGDRADKSKGDSGSSEREVLMESARSLFESKLGELSGGMIAAEAPAAPAEEPKEKKAKK